jgi:hypothetical protein
MVTDYDKGKDESRVRVEQRTVEEARAERDRLREQLKVWQALEGKWGTMEQLADEVAMWEWLIGVREKTAK